MAEKIEEAVKKPRAKKTSKKAEAPAEEAVKVEAAEAAVEAKPKRKAAPRKKKVAPVEEPVVEAVPVVEEAAPEADITVEIIEEPVENVSPETEDITVEVYEESPALEIAKKKVAFVGSECFPFVKTGGLGDVMYALPKALVKKGYEVRVFLPKYACIKDKYKALPQPVMNFSMDLCSDGKEYYVGIMEYEQDGVIYDFIDNEEFFAWGTPYTDLFVDIPKYCFFSKASLCAMLAMNWVPEVIHCHDWQAALVPVYLRTMFNYTALKDSKSILTIHNLRFQGICSEGHMRYWSGLPNVAFWGENMTTGYDTVNMMKGGISFADMVTTVSRTYADEIKTEFYGEGLNGHLSIHSGKVVGIVNGIDCDIWNPATDDRLPAVYSLADAVEKKQADKMALQEKLGLEVNPDKMMIALVSRLTDQKGLDLVNTVMPDILDEFTQVVVLGTGDKKYEDSFRYYEHVHEGNMSACITYDEALSHQFYASADAFLVPSLFEPCGLTQLIAMRYGTVPIVRETGGLKDTVEPYNEYTGSGNGFTFDKYDPILLLDAINRAKSLYFTNRSAWDDMVRRDMDKDVSWEVSAKEYDELYTAMTK